MCPHNPAKAGLRDYAGTFKNDAAYFTPPNAMGFEGNETLEGALGGGDFGTNVQIEITSTEDIVVKAVRDRFASPRLHYVKGKDFDFTNYCVVFHGKNHGGGDDSPGLGAYKTSMTWMLDGSGSLVVISESNGAGFAAIIPVVADGSLLSIFSRIKEKADKLPEPTATTHSVLTKP